MFTVGIIGAGDLGITLSQHLLNSKKVKGLCFIDDTKVGQKVNGIEVVCSISDINKFYRKRFDKLIICIGYNHLDRRAILYEELSKSYQFFTFIHDSVVLGEGVIVEDGCFLFPGVVLDNFVSVGPNSVLNANTTMAHDSKIVGHSFLAPGVVISGFCQIGSSCFIGSGTTVIDNINICNKVVIGAGSLILKNIDDPGVYFNRSKSNLYKK